MRILIANSQRNVVGGAEKYLQVLCRGLLDRGHELAIAYEFAVNQSRENIDPKTTSLATWNLAELGLPVLLQNVSKWGPDVVYMHGLESFELEDALLSSYPTVLFAHAYYGTCGTGSKCHSFPTVRPCTRVFGPTCVLLHYPRRCGGLNPITTYRLFRRQLQRKHALHRCAAVLTASESMFQEYIRCGVDPGRVHLVPLPSGEPMPVRYAYKDRNPSGRILFVSRFTDIKGGDHLIRAVAIATTRIDSVTLTMAGDGPERKRWESLARELNVPARFTGWVTEAEKRVLINETDLLAVPSLWPEPFGLVGIEAGSAGVPSVGYAVGGIPDWLKPGESGELAPAEPPTPAGLADAIVRALGDPRHYAHLCRGAWQVASRFTLEAHLTKLEPILNQSAELRAAPFSPALAAKTYAER